MFLFRMKLLGFWKIYSPHSLIDKPVPENKISKERTKIPEPLGLEKSDPSYVSSSKDIEIERKQPPPPDLNSRNEREQVGVVAKKSFRL